MGEGARGRVVCIRHVCPVPWVVRQHTVDRDSARPLAFLRVHSFLRLHCTYILSCTYTYAQTYTRILLCIHAYMQTYTCILLPSSFSSFRPCPWPCRPLPRPRPRRCRISSSPSSSSPPSIQNYFPCHGAMIAENGEARARVAGLRPVTRSPSPLRYEVARALAGRLIRALIGVIHLSRGKRGYVTPSEV